jgi:hypothetical protein
MARPPGGADGDAGEQKARDFDERIVTDGNKIHIEQGPRHFAKGVGTLCFRNRSE